MALIKRLLEKYYPHLVHYEFFIKICIDLLFLIVFILFTVRIIPAYFEVCPNQTNQLIHNYSTIFNYVANATG